MAKKSPLFVRCFHDLLNDLRLSGADILVAMAIGRFQGNREWAWPGQKRLAAVARMSDRSVRTSIKQLEKYGWLKVKRRGTHRLNRYQLQGPFIGEPAPLGETISDKGGEKNTEETVSVEAEAVSSLKETVAYKRLRETVSVKEDEIHTGDTELNKKANGSERSDFRNRYSTVAADERIQTDEAMQIFQVLFGRSAISVDGTPVGDAKQWAALVYKQAGFARRGLCAIVEILDIAGDIRESRKVRDRGAVFSAAIEKFWREKGKPESEESY